MSLGVENSLVLDSDEGDGKGYYPLQKITHGTWEWQGSNYRRHQLIAEFGSLYISHEQGELVWDKFLTAVLLV